MCQDDNRQRAAGKVTADRARTARNNGLGVKGDQMCEGMNVKIAAQSQPRRGWSTNRKSRPAKSLGASNVRVGSILLYYSGALFLS